MTSSIPTFDQLVREHWSRIRAWALYECGDPVQADDVCQETWMRLQRTSTQLDPDRNPSGWLRTVVRSVSRDLARKDVRLARPVPVPDPRPDLDAAIDRVRGANRMVAAFERLTPRQREAVDLVDRQGLAAKEVAVIMECSPATVRVLVHQARVALRSHLVELKEVVDG